MTTGTVYGTLPAMYRAGDYRRHDHIRTRLVGERGGTLYVGHQDLQDQEDARGAGFASGSARRSTARMKEQDGFICAHLSLSADLS